MSLLIYVLCAWTIAFSDSSDAGKVITVLGPVSPDVLGISFPTNTSRPRSALLRNKPPPMTAATRMIPCFPI